MTPFLPCLNLMGKYYGSLRACKVSNISPFFYQCESRHLPPPPFVQLFQSESPRHTFPFELANSKVASGMFDTKKLLTLFGPSIPTSNRSFQFGPLGHQQGRDFSGWKLVFYAQALRVLVSLINLFFHIAFICQGL